MSSDTLAGVIAGVQTLAANALSPNLTLSRIHLENAIRHLRRIDYLRGIAEGIAQAYQKLWFLDAATFNVTKNSNDEQEAPILTISDVRFTSGTLASDTSIDDVESELARRLANSPAYDDDSYEISLFCDDLSCFYEGAAGTTATGAVSLATTRQAVLRTLEMEGIDAVAQFLLPDAWDAASEGLGLNTLRRDAHHRIANLRRASQVLVALGQDEPTLQGLSLRAIQDQTSGAWSLKLISAQAVPGEFEAEMSIERRLTDELAIADRVGCTSAPIAAVREALSTLVGAAIGKGPGTEACIVFDREAIETNIMGDGRPDIDRIAQALMPEAWAEVTQCFSLMNPPRRPVAAGFQTEERDASLLPLPRTNLARPRPR